MIQTRIYSQRDWRWAWKKVGGVSNFWNIGCTTVALTSLLFVAGYDLQPDQVEERLRKVGGYTKDGLIIWAKIEKAFPKVKWVYRHYAYNNAKVKAYVDRDIPVMVEVLVRGLTGKTYRHWVLFLGDKMMMDPLSGKVVSTAKYPPIGWSEIQINKA